MDESGVRGPCQREKGRAPRGLKVEGEKSGKRPLSSSGSRIPFFPHSPTEGYTVILDNASHHRRKVLKKLARGKAGVLFLPPYSPDYNPIEKSWANMKRFLRDNLRGFFMVDFVVYEYFALRNLA